MKRQKDLKVVNQSALIDNANNNDDQVSQDTYELFLSQKDPLEVLREIAGVAVNSGDMKPSFAFADNYGKVAAFKRQYLTPAFKERINIKVQRKPSAPPKESKISESVVQPDVYDTFQAVYEDVAKKDKLNYLLEYKIEDESLKCTMLHYLISSGYFNLIKKALNDGAKIEVLDADNRNALTYFAIYIDSYRDEQLIKVLNFLIRKFFDYYKSEGKQSSILDFGIDCIFTLVCRVKNTEGFDELNKKDKNQYRDFNKNFAVRCLKVLMHNGLSLDVINEHNALVRDKRLDHIKKGLREFIEKGLLHSSSSGTNLKRTHTQMQKQSLDNKNKSFYEEKKQKIESSEIADQLAQLEDRIERQMSHKFTKMQDTIDHLLKLLSAQVASPEKKVSFDKIEAKQDDFINEVLESGPLYLGGDHNNNLLSKYEY